MSKNLIKKTIFILIILLLSITPALTSAMDVVIEGPTPDTTPPELKSLSISANDATPESTVKLSAEVIDDLSGVKSVYGYYKSPNNNSKSISFLLNQTTNKYEATISFSQYDDPGDWKLFSITLTDLKDNSITVYDNTNSSYSTQKFDYSPYIINVTGVTPKPPEPPKEDFTPPVLVDIQVIKTSAVKINEYGHIVADVTDDHSGVSNVTVSYVKPSGRTQNLYLYYNQTSQKYEGKLNIDQFDEIGTWKLQYVYMYDNEYNRSTIYDSTLFSSSSYEKRDFSNCTFEVSGTTPDLIGPIFKDLAIEVEQLSKTEALVKYTAEVTDSLSGVSSVYANFSKPSGKTFTVYFYKQLDKYVGTVKIDKFDELGKWNLNTFTVIDNKNNNRYIRETTTGTNDGYYELSKYGFTVRGLITIDPVSPSSLELSPKYLTIEPGNTGQLTAILNLTDGTSQDVSLASAGTKYTSTNPEKVKVDASGFVTVSPDADPGYVYIQAQNGKVEDSTKILIPGETNNALLTIKPFALTLAPGQSKQLYVEATKYGVTKEVTSGSTGIKYQSDNNTISVNENGLVTVAQNAAPGSAKITVSFEDIFGEANLTITAPPTVKSLAMTPAIGTVPAGETIQLSVRATYSDGSTKDVTQSLTGTTYISSDESRALVSQNGLVTVPSTATNGEVIITAKKDGAIAKSTVVVSSPILKVLEVTPTNKTLHREDSLSLSVKGTFSDGEVKDLTSKSTGTSYVSSVPSRAMVDENGMITIPFDATYGDVTITIKNGSIKTTILISVQEDPSKIMTEIKASSVSHNLYREDTVQLAITGVYGDGALKDITSSDEGTTYVSSVPSRAAVDSNGLISIPTSATYGNATISIKNGALRTTVIVTVEEKPINKLIELKANTDSQLVHRGDSSQLKITGLFEDGTTKDLTNSSEGTTYVSAVPSRAVIDENGRVTIPSSATYGPVTITIKNSGISTTLIFTVEEDLSNVLTAIQVNGESENVFRGDEIQLNVMGTFGGGETINLTESTTGTTYVSSVPSRAAVDINGKITIPEDATYGTATITIKNEDLRTTFVVIVEEDLSKVLTSLHVSGSNDSGFRGDELQLKVMGAFENGETADLTASYSGTTYVSSVPSRVAVDSNGTIYIPFNATYGSANITIKNSGLSTTFVVNVKEDLSKVLTGLEATGSSEFGFRGDEIQLEVIGTFGNGETADLTASTSGTTYISSVPSRAAVDVNGIITIPESATYGTATITVKNGDLRVSFVVTVEENLQNVIKDFNVEADSNTAYRGTELQLKVTGIYGSGEEKDITLSSTGTTYLSSVPSRALVDSNGKISIPISATYGDATITIKNGTVKKTFIVTVTQDMSKVLTKMNIDSGGTIITKGSNKQLIVTGIYGNGEVKDITNGSEGTTYVSSVPSRAIIDANGFIKIPYTATSGNVTITIKNGSLKSTVTLTVQ